MKTKLFAALSALLIATLACGEASDIPIPIPTLASSPYDLGRTLYGFFPSPPEITIESVVATYQEIGEHGDVVLFQQNVPWKDFANGSDVQSSIITDIHNQYVLAHQNGLEVIFIVDPLNGLDRSEFQGLPFGWKAGFANPKVRAAFTNYTLRIVREFHPRYLGLGSEINTYADTHPDDFANYQSLYHEVYRLVKAEAPDTQVFVTFQWEQMNHLLPGDEQDDSHEITWDRMETFEPDLDVWAISSYPFVAFGSGADIPDDYYTPLLMRTSKPLAVAEGGFGSRPIDSIPGTPLGSISGTPQDQVDYVSALHTQLGGERLVFWIYLVLTDFNIDSYADVMKKHGQGDDIGTLNLFTSVGLREFDGTPKPALETWDGFRNVP